MQVIALLLVTVIIVLTISDTTEIKIVDQKGSTILDSAKQERDGEEVDLNSLLNKLADKIDSLLKGNDPYNFPFTNLDVNNKLIRVNGYIDYSSVSNASTTNIQVHSLKENDTYYINCNVTMSSLSMMGVYNLDLYVIEQVYITGKGNYKISLNNTKVMTAIEVTENDIMHLRVKDFHFKYNVDEIKTDISGLFGGGAVGDLVKNVLNDLIQKIVKDYNPLLSKIAGEVGKSLLKSRIDGLSMANVTEIIQEIIEH